MDAQPFPQAFPPPQAAAPKCPLIYSNGKNALVVDASGQRILATVLPSLHFTAEQLAEYMVKEFRAETGNHPAGTEEGARAFSDFAGSVAGVVSTCDGASTMLGGLARHMYVPEAALYTARNGQLPNYLQAVSLLSSEGRAGRAALDQVHLSIRDNQSSEEAFIADSKPGTSLAKITPLNVLKVMQHEAATAGLRLPSDPPAFAKHPAAAGELADKLAPWWVQHGAAFLSGAELADARYPECPGLTNWECGQATEVLNAMRHTQAELAKREKSATLADVFGYGEQWKDFFALAYVAPHGAALADVARSSSPMARALRSSSAMQQTDILGTPPALPDELRAPTRRRFAL